MIIDLNRYAPIVICDIDWVIADERNVRKRHTIVNDDWTHTVNWDWYFKDLWECPLITDALSLISAPHIHFFTWRNESCRQITEDWLDANLPHIQDYTLHMRKDGDYRKWDIVKSEFLSRIDTSQVMYAIDDDAYICQMYRQHGIKFIHVFFYN